MVDQSPLLTDKALQRLVLVFVVHFPAVGNPKAQIQPLQALVLCLLYLPQHRINAEAVAGKFGVKEGINGREGVIEAVYNRNGGKFIGTKKLYKLGVTP